MIKRCILIIGICFSLIGCSNERQVNILFDDAYSLTKQSDVVSSGITIGKIDKIRYQGPDSILVTLKLDKAIFVSEDAVFQAHSNFFKMEHFIEFIPGTQTERVSKDYIFKGVPPKQVPVDTSLINIPAKVIKKIYQSLKEDKNKQDSLDIIIEDVNKNLDTLNKQMDVYEQHNKN